MNTQELQFELMKKASFNDFQAEQVVGDLKANAHLWDAALMDQPGLVKLRDLPENIWNVSTLYILTGIKSDQLYQLALSWNPTSIRWIEGEAATKKARRLCIRRLHPLPLVGLIRPREPGVINWKMKRRCCLLSRRCYCLLSRRCYCLLSRRCYCLTINHNPLPLRLR
jgi:hypothetical protein